MGRDDRADGEWTTKIVPLGNGHYGVTIYRNGKIHSRDNTPTSRQEAAKCLKHMLRWVDKMGFDCDMATASRDRFFCGSKRP